MLLTKVGSNKPTKLHLPMEMQIRTTIWGDNGLYLEKLNMNINLNPAIPFLRGLCKYLLF